MEEIILSAVNAYPDDTCRTIKANYAKTSNANYERQGSMGCTGVETNLRIRKLTPCECWKLMGFTAEDHNKAEEAGISASQRYKQAGNSIVVNVLEEIFKELGKIYDDFKSEVKTGD